jgi:hypothetical protein
MAVKMTSVKLLLSKWYMLPISVFVYVFVCLAFYL